MTAPSALADPVDRVHVPHERRRAIPTRLYRKWNTDFGVAAESTRTHITSMGALTLTCGCCVRSVGARRPISRRLGEHAVDVPRMPAAFAIRLTTR